MRDIRGDLQDRVDMAEQQISLENARFEQLISARERIWKPLETGVDVAGSC